MTAVTNELRIALTVDDYDAAVDDFEVGERVSGSVRLALGVADVDATLAAAVASGARRVGPAQVAPWGGQVARVQSPDGMQLTLFSAPSG